MAHKLEAAHFSSGLVTTPVGIYSAIDEPDVHFNQLHDARGSQIKQQRFCLVCNRDVNYHDEMTKGYEMRPSFPSPLNLPPSISFNTSWCFGQSRPSRKRMYPLTTFARFSTRSNDSPERGGRCRVSRSMRRASGRGMRRDPPDE